jgi:hypothetical protein
VPGLAKKAKKIMEWVCPHPEKGGGVRAKSMTVAEDLPEK